MDKEIRKATDIITGKTAATEKELLLELTNCAVEIGNIALTALKGELRMKAINISMAICDYEDELRKYISQLEGK